MFGAKVGGCAARAIAGDFGAGAIGVDQADLEVGGEMREHPLDSVGSHTVVTVADAAGEGGDVLRRQRALDEQEIVSAGTGLNEWNRAGGWDHSRSNRPREVALCRTLEAFN